MLTGCKMKLSILIIPIIVLVFMISSSQIGQAAQDQILLNGRVKIIDLASSTVVVTDYEGKDVSLSIQDQETIDKFRDNRIKVGDDVNIKYRIKDGRNIPFSFRKTAGC
ncbi:MAG TPA: hypothetical protein VK448_01870 [Dissulfurispiraceae bacterium]|nr:hypothetical protein [Dissulfurispiraceae bacterium]